MLLSGFVHAADLLPPLLAFKPAARALDGQTIEVRFEIAKGYYLYRDNFRFAAEPTSVQLGAPKLPKGKEKDDDTFGRVEVYYKEALIRVPVERNSSGVLPLTLHIISQGCADIGVCYPPQKQSLSLELPMSPRHPRRRPRPEHPAMSPAASRVCSRMPAPGSSSPVSSASVCCSR